MKQSFFFYDLETSGIDPRTSRIMQFAGQRTDMDLKPIGEPVNVLIRLSPDVVPDPYAIMITGITPQQTLQDGISEAEFAKQFVNEIATPGTIFVGYNSIRFDDEFMRFFLYRNFYDAYEWQWKDNRSRWDILDLIRITRALRPDGISWPYSSDGKPSNKLELLTSVNKLAHDHAHDALSDVIATISVARLVKSKQPKLFQYILGIRNKKEVSGLVGAGEPFVYTSGRYAAEYEKTAVVVPVASHPKRQAALVYDLRHDPTPYVSMDARQLADLWVYKKDPTEPRLPVKTMRYNCCPAIAPLGVLDDDAQKRLKISLDDVKKHHQIIKQSPSFKDNLLEALDIKENYKQTSMIGDKYAVDSQLYDGFLGNEDGTLMRAVVAAEPQDIAEIATGFKDSRLKSMAPLYKARNYEKSLTDEERSEWEEYRTHMLMSGGNSSRLAKFFDQLAKLSTDTSISQEKRYILEELQLYGQSIMPVYDEFVE